MNANGEIKNFYVAGGTMPVAAGSYVEREADRALFEALTAGEFCFILNARQMGKSSISVRIMTRLAAEGIRTVFVDLTKLGGKNLTPDQWYAGLLMEVGRSLNLRKEFMTFWSEQAEIGPMQRFFNALREVALEADPAPICIFIDEIDATRSLSFDTDEFFAGIRECFNRRVHDAAFNRLTMCLSGVATPSDLIKDVRTTPFNVGHRIVLKDFSLAEAAPLESGLGANGKQKLARVMYWTNGHPYLTQTLCASISQDPSVVTDADIDRLVQATFLEKKARESNVNLADVGNRVLNSFGPDEDANTYRSDMLNLVETVRSSKKRVVDDESNRLINILRLSGLVRVQDGTLQLRNRIYQTVFDSAWVAENMPAQEIRRQKTAFRMGVVRTGVGAGMLILLVSTLAAMAIKSANEAHRSEVRARELAKIANDERAKALEAQEKITGQSLALQGLTQDLRASLKDASRERDNAKRLAELASENAKKAQMFAKFADDERKRADQAATQALIARDNERNQRGKAEMLRYASDMRLVGTEWQMGDMPQLKRRLLGYTKSTGAGDLRGFEWQYQWTLLNRSRLAVNDTRSSTGSVSIAPDGNAQYLDIRSQLCSLQPGLSRREVSRSQVGPIVGSAVTYFTRDGRHLAIMTAHGRLQVYDTSSRRETLRLQTKLSGVQGLAITDDLKTLLTLSDSNFGRVIESYDLETNRTHARIILPSSNLYSLALSPQGDTFAVANHPQNSQVGIYDIHTGRERRFPLGPFGATIHSMAFSPDGGKIAVSGSYGEFQIMDLKTRENLHSYTAAHTTVISCLRFSNDGKMVVTGGTDGIVKTWDTESFRQAGTYRGLTSAITELDFSKDNKQIIAASKEGNAKVWTVEQNEDFLKLPNTLNQNSISFTRDSKQAVMTSTRYLSVVDTATGSPVARLAVPFQNVNEWYLTHALSPDDKEIAISQSDGGILIVDAKRTKRVTRIAPIKKSIRTFASQTGLGNLAYSPNGQLLVAGEGRRTLFGLTFPASIHVWSRGDYRDLKHVVAHNGAIMGLAFSPDSRKMVSVGQDQRIVLWDTATWRPIRKISTAVSPTSVAYSKDGSTIAFGDENGIIETLSSKDLSLMKHWNAHSSNVTSVAFSPDGKRLVSTSLDRLVRLWDVQLGIMTFQLTQLPQPSFACDFSPDGNMVAAGTSEYTALFKAYPTRQIDQRIAEDEDPDLRIAKAIERSKKSGKKVFVVFEKDETSRVYASLIYLPRLQPFFRKNYEIVEVQLDQVARLQRSQQTDPSLKYGNTGTTYPFAAVLNSKGSVVASTLQKRDHGFVNIGFPESSKEIDFFVQLLRTTATKTGEIPVRELREVLSH